MWCWQNTVPRRAGSVGFTVVLRAGIPRIKESSRLVLCVTVHALGNVEWSSTRKLGEMWSAGQSAPDSHAGKLTIMPRFWSGSMPQCRHSVSATLSTDCHAKPRYECHAPQDLCVPTPRSSPPQPWLAREDGHSLTTVTGASPPGDAAWVFLAEPPGL